MQYLYVEEECILDSYHDLEGQAQVIQYWLNQHCKSKRAILVPKKGPKKWPIDGPSEQGANMVPPTLGPIWTLKWFCFGPYIGGWSESLRAKRDPMNYELIWLHLDWGHFRHLKWFCFGPCREGWNDSPGAKNGPIDGPSKLWANLAPSGLGPFWTLKMVLFWPM